MDKRPRKECWPLVGSSGEQASDGESRLDCFPTYINAFYVPASYHTHPTSYFVILYH